MLGSKSYMKFQITPAATKLMAMGMKIRAFTAVSYRTRSDKTAISSPKTTATPVKKTIHRTVLPMVCQKSAWPKRSM